MTECRVVQAEKFLDAATGLHPRSVLAWTILSGVYDKIGNDLKAEMSLNEAKTISQAAGTGSVYLQTVEFLLTINATSLADKCVV